MRDTIETKFCQLYGIRFGLNAYKFFILQLWRFAVGKKSGKYHDITKFHLIIVSEEMKVLQELVEGILKPA